MDDRERQRQMSLVPYVPAESREIVLRHGSAVVVYDQRSKQLSLRGASHSAVEPTSCPYCHRAYRDSAHHDASASDDEHIPFPDADPGFVNPSYFQMLRRSQPGSAEVSRPSSPHKQLAAPAPFRDAVDGGGVPGADAVPGPGPVLHVPDAVEFVGSGPAPTKQHGISAKAFSPDYFKTFFVEERELGRGGKGVVLLVRHVLDGVNLGLFACKRVPVGDDHEWLEKVLIEVQLLQNLSHQNLVSYRHVWLEDYRISTFGPSVPCAFIMQQYCNGGDLQSYVLGDVKKTMTTEEMKERLRRRSKGQMEDPQDLKGQKRMHFEEIISFFKDITSGLNHLHANGYIHRDLKPSNCLLHNTGREIRVLVSDFGEVQVANVARKSTGATGTISYCAPEVLKHVMPNGPLGNFTTKSDIFSLGMIVYFMCFGRLPYQEADGIDEDNEDLDKLRAEISSWAGFDLDILSRVRTDLPEKLYGSLKHLLALNPADRPTTEEIMIALKSPSVLDEFSGFSGPSGLDDMEPRISRVEPPSPTQSSAQRHRNSINYTRPGRSKLSTTASVSNNSSPSPPPPPARGRASLEDSVILHPRKVDLPPPQEVHRPASPQRSPRLMLPPPPPQSPYTIIFHALHSRAFMGTAKMAIFIAKAFSLLGPCQPFATDPWVAYPLLCFASLDFLGSGTGLRVAVRFRCLGWLGRSLVLLMCHSVVVWILMRWDRLCLRRVAWHAD
ncbi:kinase-like protein [Massarina eburnea CBS 473.64]|uniref:non-specific serine/threonine protein kinase n=1 Tax=Massarina eburnea CBS 473.64 TaxID=1395130 RepID=A0A6A6S6J2_9PLEO|nr:kinase-like protein [Massarina eburnea CBS 473.64]